MPIPAPFAAFWSQAAASVPRLRTENFYEAFCFGDSEALAEQLAQLVLLGRKRATASLVWSFEAEGKPLPRPGHLSIVKTWAGQPLCVIETTRVDVLPFEQVGAAFAHEEGEDDGSLASWRRNHQAFFSRECERLGREPRPDMPVVCERFQRLYAAPTSTPKAE
jgi:uncharacterized protein YhfF